MIRNRGIDDGKELGKYNFHSFGIYQNGFEGGLKRSACGGKKQRAFVVGHNHRSLAGKDICLDEDLTSCFGLNKQPIIFELLFGKWH